MCAGYTEKPRRVIFLDELGQFGSPIIEPDYLLLGLDREEKRIPLALPKAA